MKDIVTKIEIDLKISRKATLSHIATTKKLENSHETVAAKLTPFRCIVRVCSE